MVTNRFFFTQRRKDRKDAKARPNHLTRLCVFAIFAPLRETSSVSAAHNIEFKLDVVVDAHHPVKG
jgi:hypothetical protein